MGVAGILHAERFRDVILLVAVGARKVEAYDRRIVLAHLGNVGQSDDESAKPEVESVVVVFCGDVDIRGFFAATLEHELLAVLGDGDGAKLSHVVEGIVQGWCLQCVLHGELGWEVAVCVVNLLVFLAASGQHGAEHGQHDV